MSHFDSFATEDIDSPNLEYDNPLKLVSIYSKDFFRAFHAGDGDRGHISGIKQARYSAKQYVTNAPDKAYAFWEVFSAVYKNDLEVDAWSEVLFWKAKPVTFTKLVAQLEEALQMSKPRASSGFYEGQLELLLEWRKFKPIQRYLQTCANDYTEDLPEWGTLAHKLLGVEDTLSQTMLTTWLVGAAKRGLSPGTEMKRCLILKGGQDAGKSAFVRRLGVQWASELAPGTGETDFMRLCTRTWIMELSECDRMMKGKDASVLKAQLSQTVDKYIPKFKEASEMAEVPRTTVFIGTTNKDQFLVDETGNKRFWVIDCGEHQIDFRWLEANADQLWATAYRKAMEGAPSDLTKEDQEASEKRNRGYMMDGSLTEQVERVLERWGESAKGEVAFKAIDMLYGLGFRVAEHSKHKASLIYSLKQMGYEQRQIKVDGRNAKYYALPGTEVKVVRLDGWGDNLRVAREPQ